VDKAKWETVEVGSGKDKEKVDLLEDNADFFESIKGNQRIYYFTFLACEVLNVVMVITNILITDRFLNGNFRRYGSEVWDELVNGEAKSFNEITKEEEVFNPMCNAFPTRVNCEFEIHTLTGDKDDVHALCILGQNIMNQKIYLVLWFWYYFVLIVGSMQVVFEAIILAVPAIRNKILLNILGTKLGPRDNVREYLDKCNSGDWFILYQLSKNTDKQFFGFLLHKLADRNSELYPKLDKMKAPE